MKMADGIYSIYKRFLTLSRSDENESTALDFPNNFRYDRRDWKDTTSWPNSLEIM